MKIFNVFKRKSAQIGAVYPAAFPDAVWTPTDYENLAKAGYEQNPTVRGCVDTISQAVSEISWVLYKNKSNKNKEPEIIEEHALLDRLDNPNEMQSGAEFRAELVKNFLLAGNNYILKLGPLTGENRGKPLQLINLKPHRVKIVKSDNPIEPIKGYEYKVTGRDPQFYKKEDILHIKDYHPTNDYYGLSRLQVCARSVDISNMIDEWHNRLLKNDCRPPGVWNFKGGKLSDEQQKELEKKIEEKFQGYKNAGKPPVLGGGECEWIDHNIKPRDMDHKDTFIIAMRQICAIFNVPPELLWDEAQKTYSNYREARKALYMETVLPFMNLFRDALNRWLIPMFDDGDRLYLDYDRDSIEALQENRAEKYSYLKTADWLKDNEKRAATGYDETPEGDSIYKPISMIPVGSSPKKEDEEKRFGFKSKNKSFWQAPERKEALWNNFVLRVKAKEKPFIPIAEEYMKEQGKRIQKALKDIYTISGLEPDGIFDLEAEAKAYQKKFMPWYVDTAQRAGEAGIVVSKGDLYSLESKPRGVDFEMTPELEELLQEMVYNSGTKVNETMIDIIYRTIKRAEKESWTVEELTQMINHQIDDFMPWRSRLWARTEGVKTENWGQLEGYKRAEFVEKKGWLSAFAPDTRESHMAADAQYSENPIPLEEAFIIGGESLQYPGDPAGSPENVCNCLCSTYPEVMELQGG